jgi:hypothetical protein
MIHFVTVAKRLRNHSRNCGSQWLTRSPRNHAQPPLQLRRNRAATVPPVAAATVCGSPLKGTARAVAVALDRVARVLGVGCLAQAQEPNFTIPSRAKRGQTVGDHAAQGETPLFCRTAAAKSLSPQDAAHDGSHGRTPAIQSPDGDVGMGEACERGNAEIDDRGGVMQPNATHGRDNQQSLLAQNHCARL